MAACVGQAACGGQETMSAQSTNPYRYTANATIILLTLALGACSQARSDAPPPNLDGVVGQNVAQAAVQSGDLALAAQIYAQTAAANPGDAAAQLRYADVLARGGDIAAARELL